ncbi:MAG: hypothetical protein M3M96_02140 [Candidatus Eremiobacteraeota bacterium]|nr:hypothetical protein [Candidatus Eremiobacteraeota bacterium]
MLRRYKILAAYFCAGALAACGSPSAALDFHPPQGWNAGPSIMGVVQLWIDPRHSNSVVMLMRVPASAANQDQTLRDRYLQKGHVVSDRQIKICGDHPARFSILEGSGKSGRMSRVELTNTVWNGTTYMALYGFDLGQAPDRGAESAIKGLCPK